MNLVYNQTIFVEYPCGCRYSIPPMVADVPRNCPEHWLVGQPIRVADAVERRPGEVPVLTEEEDSA